MGIDLKAEYKNLGTPGVIRDAMLAGQVQFGAVGVPTLITLADKTNLEWKTVGNIVSVPMNVNTNNASAKTVCDIKGKIALPTIKTSVQAVTLQMAAKAQCGGATALDPKTVSMTHPDGMQIKVTRQEIGRIVGCSREMVGRVLKDLEEQNLVNVKGKTMVVYGTR